MAYEFQEEGISFLRARGRAILADEPGLGKSRQAILAATEPLLILCPKMLRDVWVTEVAKWRPDCRPFIEHYEYISAKKADHLMNLRPGTLICDEAHYLKNPKAARTREAIKLSRRAGSVYLLTGNPIDDTPEDLFGVLAVMRPDRFTSYHQWVNMYFKMWNPPWGGTKIVGLKGSHRDFLMANGLHQDMLRRKRELVAPDLPPMSVLDPLETPMVAEQRKVYNRLKKDYVAWDGSGTEVSAWSDGGLHTKLRLITSSLESAGLSGGGGKLDAVTLLAEAGVVPTIWFVWARATARAVKERLDRVWGAGTTVAVTGEMPQRERDDTIRAYQAGSFPSLVASVELLSEGVTLTQAHRAVFVERSWRPTRNEQARRRIHRIGLDHPVTVQDLVTPKTVDAAMMRVLETKSDAQVKMMRAHDFLAALDG